MPTIEIAPKSGTETKYQSKFRRSGVVLNNGVYENRNSLPVGPQITEQPSSSFIRKNSAHVHRTTKGGNDILTDGGIRALKKIENTPLQSMGGKALDLSIN